MATFVGKPIIDIVHTGGDNFNINVSYTVRYTPTELTFPEGFADSMALFEDDSNEPFGGDHDHLVNITTRTFRPRQTVETRTFRFSRTRSQLGTESGGEELFAVVHHRRNIDGLASATIESDRFPLAV
ncbi:hypothetical protein SUDANB176_05058 [Streptomyces sp. enrichment culture]|uniref:hypothetical protein n=1 Tax=Streptomyces sp. enrichment culture TaxID=1795815 RepID=UPI003F56CEBD